MIQRINIFLTLFIGVLIFWTIHPPAVYSQSCFSCSDPFSTELNQCNACYQSPEFYPIRTIAWCNAWSHCDGPSYCYLMSFRKVKQWNNGLSCGTPFADYDSTYNCDLQKKNTLVQNEPACWSNPPAGCNVGNPGPGSTCGGGGGTPTPTPPGGGCGTGSGLSCAPSYMGDLCTNIPCGHRLNCNCSCSCGGNCQSGGGGQCDDITGGGGPTATPIPSPYCTLSCFGQSGGSGGLGGTPAPTILPPLITGTIDYVGYYGFDCGVFKDGLWFDGPCPTGQLIGGESRWQHQTKYNMLCGGNPHTYTAVVKDMVSSGGGGGGLPTPTTIFNTPTPALYPQGCIVGFPTPTTAGGGLGGGTSTSTDCSCSVTLSCQTSLASSPNIPNSSCTPTCDFSVNPDYPLFNQSTTFQITQNTPSSGISFAFDDGSQAVSNQTSVNHTFVNAGLYETTLTCNATNETCTRQVNAYCDNGVAPTTTPSPTPTIGFWFKLKDADFYKGESLINVIPDPINADPDDTGNPPCSDDDPDDIRCMNVNEAGITSGKATLNTGTAPISRRGWKTENYTLKKNFSPDVFLEYVKARKRYNKITSNDEIINKETIQQGKINLIEGAEYRIQADNFSTKAPFVLIVDGNLTMDVQNSFNNADKPIAIIVTGQLKIKSDITQLNGIYAAGSLDVASDIATGSTTPNQLKIIGNLIVDTPSTTLSKRKPNNQGDAPMYIRFGLKQQVGVLPLLSVKNYLWEEVSP